jgi:hypothetical protein
MFPMEYGICRLTKKYGKFVKSHILPKALTRPEAPGQPFEQGGKGTRPVRRWDSWYDSHLVIREGEDILRDLDTWAIRELRNERLVWSGWGTTQRLEADQLIVDETKGWGVRTILVAKPLKLRLFFLSLLWRAAESDLMEFEDISIPEHDREFLRLCILNNDPGPISFYQIQLTQLSTKGIIHNHTPIITTKTIPSFDGQPDRHEQICRFYIDGLIIHFRLEPAVENKLGDIVVGNSKNLSVTTVPFEGSTQFSMLMEAWADARRFDGK